MKTFILTALLMILFVAVAEAQVNITFGWDPSADGPGPADNPIKYKLYKCTDAGATICTAVDAGTALELTQSVTTGVTYWYVTAYNMGLVVDGVPSGIQESGKSNILKLVVNQPPGNPKNAKVRTYSVP